MIYVMRDIEPGCIRGVFTSRPTIHCIFERDARFDAAGYEAVALLLVAISNLCPALSAIGATIDCDTLATSSRAADGHFNPTILHVDEMWLVDGPIQRTRGEGACLPVLAAVCGPNNLCDTIGQCSDYPGDITIHEIA